MRLFFIAIAVTFGALAPTQAGINMKLRNFVGDPVLAATISFAVGTLTLIAYSFLAKTPIPAFEATLKGPWWMWTGGLMGAFFVAAAVIVAPVLGAGTMMCWMVAGQMAASIFLDHFGLIGYAVREASPMRIAGVVLVVTGAVLIEKF
ncbi:transporter family-2 protein [Maridesulfovibrio ferrireducens]|uniref:Transporter family-2 protein n=1 Tax=Maridesulfovibrio ferrireducens TaxID=246191 RepID=A0A1G9D2E0_9BACT|nr:DMT family transporter [Maridesulfovibrio ferrireducens]SDK57864.1 transporter family-2 protein [Maridesulfovibrio ferrireducens]